MSTKTPYARIDAGHLIATLRKDSSDWTESQRSTLVTALELINTNVLQIINEAAKGILFPLLAPDSLKNLPQYSFINEQTLGISRDAINGLYIFRALDNTGLVAATIEALSSGSGSGIQKVLHLLFSAGYIGSANTDGLLVENNSLGTGINYGINVEVIPSTNAGTQVAISGKAAFANTTTGYAVGGYFQANAGGGSANKASIAVIGNASSGTTRFAGFFGLSTSENPTLPATVTAACIVADVGGVGGDFLLWKDGAAEYGAIVAGGHLAMGSVQWIREPAARKVTTAAFNKTNTTLADVTLLSSGLLAGRTYKFRAVLFVDADAVGGHKYAISISSLTSIIYHIQSVDDTALAIKISSRQTASGGAAGESSGTTYKTIIEGSIKANADADLKVQFAQNAANGTSTVLAGSYFIVEDMGT